MWNAAARKVTSESFIGRGQDLKGGFLDPGSVSSCVENLLFLAFDFVEEMMQGRCGDLRHCGLVALTYLYRVHVVTTVFVVVEVVCFTSIYQ